MSAGLLQIIFSVVSILQTILSKANKLYWEDSFLEELPFDGDVERWTVLGFGALSIISAILCIASSLKQAIVGLGIGIGTEAVTMVGEIVLYALFCVSYFKADDYPTDIGAVLALLFMPLIIVLTVLVIIMLIVVIRKVRLFSYNVEDDGACELTTAGH